MTEEPEEQTGDEHPGDELPATIEGSVAEPSDPAGTQPKVDRDSLLPVRVDRERPPPFEPPVPLPEPVGAAGGPARLRDGVEPPHAARFQFILGALLAVGAIAVVGLIWAVGQSGTGNDLGTTWSPWSPQDDGAKGAQEIAEHVGPNYRLSTGEQLVLATGGKPEVAGLPVTFVKRDEEGEVSLVEGDGVLYRLCGLGPKCSINKGKPSQARHLLLRREALELALYSFRYLDGVDQVVVLMPPPPGSEADQALFFRRGDVKGSLQSPLTATLISPAPNVGNVRKARDAALVNRLTTRGLFNFSLTQGNQDANVFLVLEPFDPTATANEGGSSGSGSGSSGSGSSGSGSGSGESEPDSGSGAGGLTATPTDPS